MTSGSIEPKIEELHQKATPISNNIHKDESKEYVHKILHDVSDDNHNDKDDSKEDVHEIILDIS